ncbi:MAG: OsmC family protein [Simkaniaceae bacterium]|nr:OsmC family protein [Simkaniaceae bacterium]
MSKMTIVYENELRTHCSQENGTFLITDGPKELKGKGEFFSPTDLFAHSLGACILTMMGLAANKLGLDLTGTTAEVDKQMATAPHRRVGKISVHIKSPLKPTDEQKAKLEQMGLTCPVHSSLHPDIEQDITFTWG